MFDSNIKRGVTFISTAFFYTLTLRFVESSKSDVERLLEANPALRLYLSAALRGYRLQSGLGHPLQYSTFVNRCSNFEKINVEPKNNEQRTLKFTQ